MERETIIIRNREQEGEAGYPAEVEFPSGKRFEITIKDPFREAGDIESDQENRLRWYFEEHLKSPFTEMEKAKRAAGSIAAYGETLFASLFGTIEARVEWCTLARGLNKIRLLIDSEHTGFQALLWEALKVPGESKPLCA
ncbi:MAG: hypothetical protein GY757_35640, partial [bacterium]|nr:hypothetical protein [bacterium]